MSKGKTRFDDLQIRTQLVLGILVVLVLSGALIYTAASTSFNEITEGSLSDLEATGRIRAASFALLAEYREYVATRDPSARNQIVELEVEVEEFKQIYASTSNKKVAEIEFGKRIEIADQNGRAAGSAAIDSVDQLHDSLDDLEEAEENLSVAIKELMAALDERSRTSIASVDLTRYIEVELPPALALRDMLAASFDYFSEIREYVVTPDARVLAEIESVTKEIVTLEVQFAQTAPSEIERPLIDRLDTAQQNLKTAGRRVISQRDALAERLQALESAERGLEEILSEVIIFTVAKAKSGQVRSLWLVLGSICLATVFACLFAWWLATRIARPIESLAGCMQRFGEGGRDERAHVASANEVGLLATTFNQMATELQRSTVSSDFLEGLLQSMLDGLIVIAPDGTIRMVNRGLVELLDREKEELLGTPVNKLFADSNFSSGSRIESLLQNGLIGHRVSSLAAKGGEEIPVSLSSSLLLSGDTIDGIVCVAQDLRGRLRLQEEVLHQRDLLHGTLASIGDGVIACDKAAKVTFLNHVAEELTGWSQAEAVGAAINDIFDISNEHSGAVARSPVHRVLEGGGFVGLENRIVLTARDGRRVPIEDSAAPIRDKDGELRGVILVFRNVSERRQVELDLLNAKVLADRANRSKSEFLAMMSHEIRTPLNGIVGVSQLLLDSTDLSAQERGYAETIGLSSDTLMALIDEILDFSRFEAGTVKLERKAFALLACVEDTLDIVAMQSLKKGLELHYHLDPSLPAIMVGDANRLRQVLINLVSNAIKFTAAGEISLRVTEHHDEGPEKSEAGSTEGLLFAIKDTGVGIQPDAVKQVFEPFQQIDSSSSRKHEGSGLGLAICKRLIELMGGKIWLESSPGTGTTFFFNIAMPSSLRSGDANSRTHLSAGKRAIIVSGSATQLSVLSSLCSSLNIQTSTTSTGEEALALLADRPADIAIIDFDTVDMDTADLRTSICPQVPVIALIRPGASTIESLEDLPSECIFKPIKHSALLSAITRILTPSAAPDKRLASSNPRADPNLAARLPLRILVADDNITNRTVAELFLQSMGYEAVMVVDGSSAVEAAVSQRFDVVFMDLQMPGMDGVEATRKIIEALGQVDRPRIIALTASALNEDRERCFAAGMDDYICKPVRPSVLREKLLLWGSSEGNAGRSSERKANIELAPRTRTP